ncbi:hypothetical protein ACIKTA_19310, partial [Hansschlegelia beijingensis]
PFRFELTTIEALERHRAAWDDLASRALEPNLFCEADFALAARRMAVNRRVRIAVVWDDEGPGAPRMMLAVAVRPRRLLPLVRMLTNTDWAFFGALGTPLIDRERPTLALESFLEGLRGLGQTMFLFRFLLTLQRALAAPDSLTETFLPAAALGTLLFLPMNLLTLWGAARLAPTRLMLLLMCEVGIAFASSAILADDPFGPRE